MRGIFMRLKLSTDYAIRIILYLATENQIVPILELSTKLGIPQSLVFKINKKLKFAGIINTYSGLQGSVSLALPAERITLYQIVNIMESTTIINRCLEDDEYCSPFSTSYCPVRKFYCRLQNDIETALASITIASLLENSEKD